MGIDSEELIDEVEQEQQNRGELAEEALQWFLDEEHIGEFYPRMEVVEDISVELSVDTRRANNAISDTVGDIVDPVQQISTRNTKYVGVMEYRVYSDEGAYGYIDFNDKKRERKRVVCAKCVEEADYDEEVIHATQGEGTSNEDATWHQLLNKITAHYAESHIEGPSEIEPGASLLNGTTISGNIAHHSGNYSAPVQSVNSQTGDVSVLDGAVIDSEVTSYSDLGKVSSREITYVSGKDDIVVPTNDNLNIWASLIDGQLVVGIPVFAIGGRDTNSNTIAAVEKWDGSSWSSITNMPTAREKPGATTDNSGNVYVIGGVEPGGGGESSSFSSVVEKWDGSSWSTLPDVPTSRRALGAATDDNGNIYAIGGLDSSFTNLSAMEKWDGSSWSTLPDMPTARGDFAAATDDSGDIYAIGGSDINFDIVSTVEKWDGSSWSSVANMPTAREGVRAATDDSGDIYAIGGTDPNFNTLSTVEKWDGSSWSSVANMPTKRDSTGVATDESGNIYVMGGFDANFDKVSTVEKWDGSSWSTIANMPTPRGFVAGAGTPITVVPGV